MMQPDFWNRRWSEGRIGFHRAAVNPTLIEFATRLAPRGDERVLVPLCGKSVDLVWLEQRGHEVVGSELVPQAIREFLAEQGRTAEVRENPPFRVHESGRITLYEGDFLALDARRVGRFGAIWDRAALIALPAELRAGYARRLLDLLAPGGRILLVGLEYDPRRMEGPPFCVPRAQARDLFGASVAFEELRAQPVLDQEPQFRERGLDWLTEYACLLTRS